MNEYEWYDNYVCKKCKKKVHESHNTPKHECKRKEVKNMDKDTECKILNVVLIITSSALIACFFILPKYWNLIGLIGFLLIGTCWDSHNLIVEYIMKEINE